MRDLKENDLRRLIRGLIKESLEPRYVADLDAVLGDLQKCLKSLEDAQQFAPDPTAKVVIAGMHSDLFNAVASARGYILKLKTGKPVS